LLSPVIAAQEAGDLVQGLDGGRQADAPNGLGGAGGPKVSANQVRTGRLKAAKVSSDGG
jgi:hypothetical protein